MTSLGMGEPNNDEAAEIAQRPASSGGARWISAASIRAASDTRQFVTALEVALSSGIVDDDSLRHRLSAGEGQVLLMPAVSVDYLGVKLITVANSPRPGLPLVQGVYVLFDAVSLSVVAMLDAAELTAVRTAAVSSLAAKHLAPSNARRLLVFGTGVQARAHILSLWRLFDFEAVDVVGSSPASTARFCDELRDRVDVPIDPAKSGAVRSADIVCCCTTSRTPLFDGAQIGNDQLVIAIGAYSADTRELDSQLMSRSTVVVESIDTALAEAGDVIIPVMEGTLDPAALVTIADATKVAIPRGSRPIVFKGTGMSWQDLTIAQSIYLNHGGQEI